jgi:hypothetical protein
MINSYLKYMAVRDLLTTSIDDDSDDDNDGEDDDAEGEVLAKTMQLKLDMAILEGIKTTRYLHARDPVPKSGNMHIAWIYAEDPKDHNRFQGMFRVSPLVFQVILELIQDHKVFQNNSNTPQTPVDIQLAVALYRLGHYGNAASVQDVARMAGIGDGSVENFTYRCFDAIESLHSMFMRPLTRDEKEREKQWMDDHVGFRGLWREGWIMYDGTIVVLFSKPGLNGDAYYTRKANYGLNVQV